MIDLEWGRGWLWPALVALPFVWALVFALFDRSRQALLRYGATPRRGSGGPFARSLRLTALLLLGLLCWMDPRSGEETVAVERRGLDVIVCLDTSRSMLAGDMEPNRLQRENQLGLNPTGLNRRFVRTFWDRSMTQKVVGIVISRKPENTALEKLRNAATGTSRILVLLPLICLSSSSLAHNLLQ